MQVEVADGVATVRLGNGPVNVLDRAMQEEIGGVARALSGDDAVRAIVITGTDRAFAAGADVAEFGRATHADMLREAPRMQACWRAVQEIPKPVVAAIAGWALGGGCELALCADRRIAASTAVLGQPEIALGIIPGIGGTQRLTRLIGPSRAADLLFTGRHVPADEALAMGLVDEVVAPDQVVGRAQEWAGQFAHGPAKALAAAKRLVQVAMDLDLEAGLEAESAEFAALFATRDREIGVDAFVAKRPGPAPFVGE